MAKLSYETHFRSNRADGRFVCSLAAYMEKLRNTKPELSLPEELTPEIYSAWRKKVKAKYRELLLIPEITKQPDPVKLSSVKRDGYTAEKWEFYPDEYEAVPFIVLKPDNASKENKVPGVICLPGSVHSKEFISGEPLLDPPNCRFHKFEDRNEMALYMVKNGMTAFAFDNIATAECGMPTSNETADEYNYYSRSELVHGYLHGGYCYPGMTTYHMLSFMQYLHIFDYVDGDKLAVSAHSLGTEGAMALGVLCDDIKAVVFNDYLHSDRDRFVSVTESEEGKMGLNPGNWHLIPGFMRWFDFPDLCAAIAPKYLAFNEGGADQYFDTVKKAYELMGASDKLQISHYPKYKDEKSRINKGKVPLHGLTAETYQSWCYCDAPDHSFREEPSIRLLKKCFNLK